MQTSEMTSTTTFEDWRRKSLKEVERWLDLWPVYVPEVNVIEPARINVPDESAESPPERGYSPLPESPSQAVCVSTAAPTVPPHRASPLGR